MSEATAVAAQPEKAFGVWSPAMTPLDADLQIDTARAIDHIQRLLAAGCHGIVLFGTTGEANSFSVAERQGLLDAVLAAGVAPGQLMVGNGCCALSDTLALTRHALEAGCGSVLMLPPFYYKGLSDEALYRSFAEVVDRIGDADLLVYFYHFPKLSAAPITHAVIARLLAAYPGIFAGLKDSSGDAEGCAAFIESFPEMAIFPGTELFMLDMLKKGGAGTITASANVNPTAIRRVYDAWTGGSGDVEALQAQISAVRKVLQAKPTIPGLKETVARQRNDPAWRHMRPPMVDLSAEEADSLARELDQAGFAFSV